MANKPMPKVLHIERIGAHEYVATENQYDNTHEYVRSPEWVSVADELPEKEYAGMSVSVLVVQKSRERFVAYYDYGQVTWVLESSEKHLNSVTHWMPLPLPPEAQND